MPSSSSVVRNPQLEPGRFRIAVPSAAAGDARSALVYSENDVSALCQEAARQARQQTLEETAALRAKAEAEANQLLQALGHGVEQLQQAEQTWPDECVDRLVQLAMKIALRLMRAELQTRPEAMEDSVRSLLARASKARQRILRLSPEDAQRLAASGRELTELAPHLEVVADPAIAPGGAFLETETNHWDAQLEPMLEGLERHLRDELGLATDRGDTGSGSPILRRPVPRKGMRRDLSHRECLRDLRSGGRPLRSRARVSETVVNVTGSLIESKGPWASVGEICPIVVDPSRPPVPAEVVGFRGAHVLLMAYGDIDGLRAGAEVLRAGDPLRAPVGDGLLGRVVDGLGRPIDPRRSLSKVSNASSMQTAPPPPLERVRIQKPLATGIRAIDGLLTLGQGQRMGIFAGSGVGKSVLLGSMARHTDADVVVVALVGERGREVRDFLERDLTARGLERSVVVVATSDQPALLRVRTAFAATRMAERFREEGKHVLLLMDSLTRVAMAQREIGLAIGEPPTTRGYTPSVFSLFPRLLERAGAVNGGSITGLYTVLVEGDDLNEPVADAARSVLDGHIVLSRRLANQAHYPAIDVLQSVSRLANELLGGEEQAAQARIRSWLAAYEDARDLIQLGAYVPGSQPRTDEALARLDELERFLRQGPADGTSWAETVRWMCDLTTGAPSSADAHDGSSPVGDAPERRDTNGPSPSAPTPHIGGIA